MLTLILCVYTALHLNIPAPISGNVSKVQELLGHDWARQAQWMFLGLMAPEVVVYSAWLQQRLAKQISARMHGKEDAASAENSCKWTSRHSWYLLMGGFVFRTQQKSAKDAFIPECPDLTLNANGLDYLLSLQLH